MHQELDVVNETSIKEIFYTKQKIYTAFADDATFLLNVNKSTFEFLIISSLKLNKTIYIVIRVGSLKSSLETFYNDKKIVWTNDTLGIVSIHDKVKLLI